MIIKMFKNLINNINFFFFKRVNIPIFIFFFFVLFFLIHFFFNLDIRDVTSAEFTKILQFINNFFDNLSSYTFIRYFDISYFWTEFRREFNILPKVVEPSKIEKLTCFEYYQRKIKYEFNYQWWVLKTGIDNQFYKWFIKPLRLSYYDDYSDIAWKVYKKFIPVIVGLSALGLIYYNIYW